MATVWVGRKKLTLVPVYRPNAHPPTGLPRIGTAISCDDTVDPDPNTGADRSLRTYIHTTSSGLADLDAVVMPMVVVDQQNVPVDALEGQLGATLRAQGFESAALVMLGGVGAGTSQRGGFWARFVMVEAVGVWAMEFMHCLTGFADLYTLDGYSDYPQGDLGAFPRWLAIAARIRPRIRRRPSAGLISLPSCAHTGRAATYSLHSVSLIQPPPSGRSAAIRIGSQVPYLMVESRQMADQFDANIPSQGVIVYRVQTSDPLGGSQNNLVPVFLLTATALTPGQAFTSDTNITVSVTGAIPGGFTVVVDDQKTREMRPANCCFTGTLPAMALAM